ncbi:MAG: NosD domain-containing protein, partial [bacterium]
MKILKKHLKYLFFTLTCLLLLVLFADMGNAETIISGVIKQDVQWKPENSPYIITGDIFIPKFITLTILPGTKIIISKSIKNISKEIEQIDNMDSSMISIKINGGFLCKGNPEQRITFRPDISDTNKCWWYGIYLFKANPDYSIVSYTDIQGSFRGVYLENCSVPIHHNIIDYNHSGVTLKLVDKCNIFNNSICSNFFVGIKSEKSSPHIFSNIIALFICRQTLVCFLK